ncbi:hypothetical protein CCMA1212_006726 [Trichoderma ghanense]|uniref:Uncharacterized protein n=1 Tax=Trichoderma ghanense TaxID=65468 RepID=A0ABY2H0C4_9HYPO
MAAPSSTYIHYHHHLNMLLYHRNTVVSSITNTKPHHNNHSSSRHQSSSYHPSSSQQFNLAVLLTNHLRAVPRLAQRSNPWLHPQPHHKPAPPLAAPQQKASGERHKAQELTEAILPPHSLSNCLLLFRVA